MFNLIKICFLLLLVGCAEIGSKPTEENIKNNAVVIIGFEGMEVAGSPIRKKSRKVGIKFIFDFAKPNQKNVLPLLNLKIVNFLFFQ
jgi:hypothetical protein